MRNQPSTHRSYSQISPYLIAFFGLIFGLYSFFYLTTVEATVNSSLSSNLSPQSLVIAAQDREENYDSSVSEYDDGLQSLIENYAALLSSDVGIYVKQLASGSIASLGHDTTFKAASLYKLFVAYEALLRVDEQRLALDSRVGYEVGNTTVERCLERMISVSDNDCGRAMRKLLDVNHKPLPRLADLGFIATNLTYAYPTTSARDVALMFEKLYNQSDLSEHSNALLMTYLKNQQINNRIPAGLNEGTEVAHKTGNLEGYSHDAGIVYSHHGDYILVIMGGPWVQDTGTVNFHYAELTSMIDDYLDESD